jgi:hypothetical protein
MVEQILKYGLIVMALGFIKHTASVIIALINERKEKDLLKMKLDHEKDMEQLKRKDSKKKDKHRNRSG